MPKNKPHKGILKRVRITKSGLVKTKHAYHKHLRSGKSSKRLRHLRLDKYFSNPDAKRLEKMLFCRLRGRSQPLTARKRSPSPEQRRAMKAEAAKE